MSITGGRPNPHVQFCCAHHGRIESCQTGGELDASGMVVSFGCLFAMESSPFHLFQRNVELTANSPVMKFTVLFVISMYRVLSQYRTTPGRLLNLMIRHSIIYFAASVGTWRRLLYLLQWITSEKLSIALISWAYTNGTSRSLKCEETDFLFDPNIERRTTEYRSSSKGCWQVACSFTFGKPTLTQWTHRRWTRYRRQSLQTFPQSLRQTPGQSVCISNVHVILLSTTTRVKDYQKW